MAESPHSSHLKKDLLIILAGIGAVVAFSFMGILDMLLGMVEGMEVIGAFVAGIFFTSSLTIAFASVAIAHIAATFDPLWLAFCGALGAIFGDIAIFLFLRDNVRKDMSAYVKKTRYKKTLSFFRRTPVRIASFLLGAVIIASPLPDELGLAIMGFSRTKIIYLVPVSFAMNFIGIFTIASVARMI